MVRGWCLLDAADLLGEAKVVCTSIALYRTICTAVKTWLIQRKNGFWWSTNRQRNAFTLVTGSGIWAGTCLWYNSSKFIRNKDTPLGGGLYRTVPLNVRCAVGLWKFMINLTCATYQKILLHSQRTLHGYDGGSRYQIEPSRRPRIVGIDLVH